MKKLFLPCLLVGLAISHAWAQGDKALARLNRDAQNNMNYQAYETAIGIYDQLLKAKPEDLEYNYQMGVCKLNAYNTAEGFRYLKKVSDANPNYKPELPYMLGEAYRLQYQFEEAKGQYAKAKPVLEQAKSALASTKMKKKERAKRAAELDKYIQLCDKRMVECDNAMKLSNEPINAEVTNLGSGVNTKYPEYTPLAPRDTSFMIFTSRREGTTGGKSDWQDNHYYEDIYKASRSGNKWGGVEQLKINKKYHDAAAALSSDGKTLYLYRDNRKTKGDLFVSEWDDTKKIWKEPKKLNGNINTKFMETALTISADGNTMYFASDRPGGSGGLDIYRSQKQANGDWGPAENVGKPINTEFDDDAPFLSLDGNTLYFSSKGHDTAGGYDIFKSVKEGDKWGQPKNMGFPINSPDDDVHMTLTEDNRTGFYVSADPNGYGDKDIYQITAPRMTLSKLTKDGLVITPSGQQVKVITPNKPDFAFLVLFDFDRSTLRPLSKESCDKLLKYMQDNPTVRIELGGHTCNIGSMEYNQALSLQRSKAVSNYLVERGIDANRIEVKGYSFSEPAFPNTNEPNRAKNRRTEFKVLDK